MISLIPSLPALANFSWFIGVALGAGAYRWIARDEMASARAGGDSRADVVMQ